jgi:hypothetical protein
MPRTKAKLLGLVCFSVLVLTVTSLAQQAAGKEGSSYESSSAKTHPWIEGPPGVMFVVVPQPEKNEPEFVILQLKPDAYKEFLKDKEKFLNRLQEHFKIVSKPIRKLSTCPLPESKDDPPPDKTYHYVVITHWPTSDAAYQVYEGWEAPK